MTHDSATAVEMAVKSHSRVVDKVAYLPPPDDVLLVTCGPFTLSIKASSIPELASIARDEIKQVKLSAGGTSIIIEPADVYIESASLIIDEIDRFLKSTKVSNVIVDHLRG